MDPAAKPYLSLHLDDGDTIIKLGSIFRMCVDVDRCDGYAVILQHLLRVLTEVATTARVENCIHNAA
jgi:hypothetical protein